jgi:5'-nucleotidase
VRFKANDNPALPATWTKDFGDIRVGFVGTVTEHLPELVSPGGIEDIKVTDIVAETNAAADDLVDNQNADIVVMLVHEGAPNTNCTTMDDDPTSDFGSIITGVNENVDAIISGHTHLEYNCSFPVAAWAGRDVTERPVVSAGQYGAALNQIVFTVDDTTGDVVAKSQGVLHLKNCTNSTACTNFDTDAPTQAIVDSALSEAAVLGAVPLGQIAGPMKRGYLANGTTENRGVESTVGNLVAEAQRWQTSGAEAGGAQIAFMNPGGLRTDMLGVGTDPYPRTVTYKQAAEVQPFANGLVNMDLTGAQIKAALEQQWQPGGASRPFLKLGASKGFTYSSDPDAAQGSRITGMWLDGVPIVPATVYSVTVNGFLATGGDNFGAFAGGTNKAEAGLTDLQAMVNYFDEFANTGAGQAERGARQLPACCARVVRAGCGRHLRCQRLVVQQRGRPAGHVGGGQARCDDAGHVPAQQHHPGGSARVRRNRHRQCRRGRAGGHSGGGDRPGPVGCDDADGDPGQGHGGWCPDRHRRRRGDHLRRGGRPGRHRRGQPRRPDGHGGVLQRG